MNIKTPPHSIEAERSLIWSIFIDRDSLQQVNKIINADDFYDECNKIIWHWIIKLKDANVPIDLITLPDLLERNKQLERIWWIEYLADISSAVPTSAHIKQYAEMVKETSTRRKLIRLWDEIIGKWFKENTTIEEIVNDIKSEVINISVGNWTSNVKKGSDLKNVMYEELERKELLNKQGKDLIINSHWLSFERWSHTVIWALPAHWKSMLLLALLLDMAQQWYKVLYVNIEMTEKQVLDRIYAYFTKVDSTVFKYLDSENIIELIKRWEEAFKSIENNFAMITKWQISSAEIYSTVWEMVMDKWLDVHWVDYLWILTENKGMWKTEQVSLSSNTIRSIAKDFNTISLTATQFNKTAYNEFPWPWAIKDASTIYDDADIFIVLFMENEDDGLTQYTHKVVINKNRTWNLGTLYYKLDPRISEFKQITDI